MANKCKIVPKIYTPRPRGVDSDEEDLHAVKQPQESDEPPAWHRHFEQDELLGRYEPIQEKSKFCCI